MKTKKLIKFLFYLFIVITYNSVSAQNRDEKDPVQSCGTDQAMREFHEKNPDARTEAQKHEKFLKQFIQMRQSSKTSGTGSYVIPTVFHVFGTDFAGKKVTNEIIQNALKTTNEDFQGLTADWNTVDADFVPVREELDISFKLAQLDPNGNPTTGVKYYPVRKSFGNAAGEYEINEIKKYAWDNYKYCNVYIMLVLEGSSTTNSGVAWYPKKSMSDAGTARVVYNGRYLGTNTNENFRSVLTHEFGHWLNLIHTFEGGCPDSGSCSQSGDKICDTPPADRSSMNGALNCQGKKTNWHNFMDYSNNYAMYTTDQVIRMEATLQDVVRKPLWQQSNLTSTGLLGDLGPRIVYNSTYLEEQYTNNGSFDGVMTVATLEGAKFAVTSGNMQEGVHFTTANIPAGLTVSIAAVNADTVKVTLTGNASAHETANDANNIGIIFKDAAFSGHTASQIKGHNMPNIFLGYIDPYKFQYGVFDEKAENIIDGSHWSYFKLGNASAAPAFGLFTNNAISYDDYRLLLEAYGQRTVVTDVRDIVPLQAGVVIGSGSNWVDPENVDNGPDLSVLVRNGYDAWKGKIAFAGVSFSRLGRPPSYGWIRAWVSADGTRSRVIDWAYKEEPGASITAGELPGSMLSSTALVLYESEANNGVVSDQLDFVLSGGESFTMSNGAMTQGVHYTVSSLPEGLSTEIVGGGQTKATLKINGTASSHSDGDSRRITINFLNPAFAGNNAGNVRHTTFNLEVRLLNAYRIVHRIYSGAPKIDVGNQIKWVRFETQEDGFWEYALYWTPYENALTIISKGRSFIIDKTTKNALPVAAGTQIGASSNFFHAGYWPAGYPVLTSAKYTALNGKTSYIGIRFKDPAGRLHYGWMKIEVASDGKSGKLLDMAYNSAPGQPINAGETGPAVPCHSGSSIGTEQHLSSLTIGSFSQYSNITKSYTDNTGKTIKLRPAEKYPVEAVLSCDGSICNYHWFRIWIDLNNDNDFDDTGELIYYAPQSFKGTHTGEINIPNISGTFRMRVALKNSFNSPVPTPCDYYLWGETEDYTVNINSSNPLLPSILFETSETSVIEKDAVTFTDKSTHNPTSWVWTFPGGTPSSSTVQNPVVKYNTVGIYDVTLVASNADGSTSLTKLNHITVVAAPSAYCVPKHSNPGTRYIKSVKLETLNNATGQGLTSGYSDYTGLSTKLDAGKTYTIDALTPSIAWTTYARNIMSVWIDFNQNNSFGGAEKVWNVEATEALSSGGVYPQGQITIPANLPSGNYRMRVRHSWVNTGTQQDPCIDEGEGEAEDYTLVISGHNSDTEPPTVPTGLVASNVTNTSVDLSWTASTDNVGVTGYDVYNGSAIAVSVTGNTATVGNLTAGTTYGFTVRAKDATGNTSEVSSTLSVTTTNADGGMLQSGVTANGNMDSADGSDMWYIDIPANTTSLRVVLECGNEDFDTFGKAGSEPTATSGGYDWRGYTYGGEDNTIDNPAAGRHYIMVRHYSGSGNYTLTATLTGNSASGDQQRISTLESDLVEIITYPNPNDGNFILRLLSAEAGELSIEVYNLAGRLIATKKQDKLNDAPIEVPMNLSTVPGVYTLRIKLNGSDMRTSLFIIE